MSKPRRVILRPRQLLGLCYAAAAVFWVLRCLLGCGIMLNHKLGGRMPTLTLGMDDLQTESLVPYAGQEGWLVSSDTDPHLIWEGEAYVETVRLRAQYKLPPGGVVLYYRTSGQSDFSERQKVYASVEADGAFRFALGGAMVTALRIDTDSLGGIPVHVDAIEINPTQAWYLRFVPGGGWWLLLLFLPPFAAALGQVLLTVFTEHTRD